MKRETRTVLAAVVLALLCLVVIVSVISAFSGNGEAVDHKEATETRKAVPKTERRTEAPCDEEELEEGATIDPRELTPEGTGGEEEGDGPPNVGGEVVCVPICIPEELDDDEAVMINEDKENLPQTSGGNEVAVYLYDHADDQDLNLIVESQEVAVEVWWSEEGEWLPCASSYFLDEDDSTDENIEFLMPRDTTNWGSEIWVRFSPIE